MEAAAPPAGDARQRLLTAAYELFSGQGVQAVGVDAIIERSGVARQTMYRHFGSKQELVIAFLARREELWTYGWLAAEVRRRTDDPRERLLTIFDVFDGWFRSPNFEGCSFINVMLEHPDPKHPLHRAAAEYLGHIRDWLAELATDAGIADPESFARQWHILMKGSIVAAGEGDEDAALRAQRLGTLLLNDAYAGRARKTAVSAGSRVSGRVSPVRTKPTRS